MIKHVPGLDGIRGLAILLVVCLHGRIPGFRGGFVGVDIFFVISGFLITRIVLDAMESPRGLSVAWFYKRRFMRIVPALLMMMAVLTPATLWLPVPWDADKYFRTLLPDLLFTIPIRNVLGKEVTIAHLWSLGVEAYFYVMLPLAALALWRFRWGRWVFCILTVGIIGLAAFARPYVHVYNLGQDVFWLACALWRPEGLAVGCLIAAAARRARTWPAWWPVASYVALATLLAVTFLASPKWILTWGCSVVVACTAVLVLGLAWQRAGWTARLLEWKPMRWTGEISYSLYLWHAPLTRVTGMLEWDREYQWAFYFLLSYAVAAASYYLVELPCMNWGRSSDPKRK